MLIRALRRAHGSKSRWFPRKRTSSKRLLGATGSAVETPRRFALLGLRPGARELLVQRAGAAAQRLELKLKPAETRRIELGSRDAGPPTPSTLRGVVQWSSLGLAASGLVLAAAGVAAGYQDKTVLCSAALCPEAPLARAGGFPLIAVGYTAALGGATTALATWLGDDEELPLWEVLGGVAVAAASVLLTLALDPPDRYGP